MAKKTGTSEKELRRDVALANRIIERFGLSTAFGHASARIPGTNRFYISTRRSPGLADENNLLVIDTEGKLHSGKGTPNSEFWIHARIYAARPDVNGIVHAHPLACVALTQIGEPHRVVHNQGGVFVDGVPEYRRIGLIRSAQLGDQVARSLGDAVAVTMRGHGITTAFGNVRAATVAACFLEESASIQMRMLAATGGNAKRIRAFTREEAELTRDQTGPGVAAAGRAWEYYSAAAEEKPLGGKQSARGSVRVLIAGAGPVGLVAANCLADAGVPVTVFEAEPRLPENLRASTFQPPTLDMLARFGAARRLIEMGRTAPRLQYRDRAGWMAEFDLGVLSDVTAHPFRVQCEQFRLNGILAERLAQFPHARIEFASPVTGVAQDGDAVTVTVEGPAGRREERGRWLIGADGGRSSVREALGIPLEGFTWPERFLVASTRFEFADVIPNLADVSYFADPEQWFFLLRVVGLWRAMFPTRPEEGEEDILSDESVERRLQGVWRRPQRYETVHRTLYSVHQRVAQGYRKGRAFLAGDAAHLNNPLGGMGMNGGIHDAFNLAEKLVRVLRGEAGEDELDRYERQRRPIALEYVNTITIANKRNLETADPREQRQWRETMTRAAGDPALAREYLLRVSMIASLRRAAALG